MSSRRLAAVGRCVARWLPAAPQPSEPQFPKAHREVAPIVDDSFSTEDARDRLGEAEEVMALAGMKPGMSVADVGAGAGYYTVRLSRIVGPKGRVLAEDIIPETRDQLSERVQRESLDNVAVKLGTPDDPTLPHASFDRVFLVHMYHEVESPYAFLWHLRDGVKPDGLVIVVDSRPAGRPPRDPAGATQMRIRGGRAAAGEISGDDWRRGVFHGVPAGRATADPGQGQGLPVLEQANAPETGALIASEHEMVEQCAVERLGSGRQAARRAAIRLAWPAIPAGMIVGQNDPGAAVLGGVGDDRPEREIGAGLVAVMAGQVEASRMVIDMRDPQALTPRFRLRKQPPKNALAAASPSSFSGCSAR